MEAVTKYESLLHVVNIFLFGIWLVVNILKYLKNKS